MSKSSNPYESPNTESCQTTGLEKDSSASGFRPPNRAIRITSAILIAFVFSPFICVGAWLLGYGPGGPNELQAGYVVRGMFQACLFSCPIHLLVLTIPRKSWSFFSGIAVSAFLLIAQALYWFLKAAIIANV